MQGVKRMASLNISSRTINKAYIKTMGGRRDEKAMTWGGFVGS